MRRPSMRLAALAIASVLMIGIVAAACSRGSKPPPPPPATGVPASPAAAATPTPAPADAALGQKLQTDGEFEAAINVYAAVASTKSGEEQQRARLAQAQLLVRTGRLSDAVPVLEAYLADAGAAADGSEAAYMLASALDDLGDPLRALDGYTRYIAAAGVLTDYARIEQAKLLARLGRPLDAEPAAEQVMASNILPDFKRSFMFSMGSALEQGGAAQFALNWYNRALIDGGDVASALARIAGAKQALGDPSWSADALRAIALDPQSAVASGVLDQLDAASVPVSDYLRGVIDYRAGKDADARTALTSAIAAGDRAAEATYYLAAIDERAGNTDMAISEYQTAHDLDPASPLADSALWWRGRLLEQAGRTDAAAATYAALLAGYPASQWADDAAFHRGLVMFRAGEFTAAADAWAGATSSSNADAARAQYWRGRALMAADDPRGKQLLRQLVNNAPQDAPGYYALRAEVLLGETDSKKRTPKLDAGAPDWSKIAKYVDGTLRVDTQATPPAAGPRWDVAAALEDVGLHAQSDAVYRSILADDATNAPALFRDAQRLQEEGRTSLAARAATTLASLLAQPGAPPLPDDLLRVAYPVPYQDLVSTAAKDRGVSPLLLLALVRQESFYDPEAGSTAGALGLTQVIPSTGESIAATLGVVGFSPSDLYRPNVSLQFGASYLAGQLKQFDSDPYRALAAYNGGPGTAATAAQSAGADEDLFVADLEFSETRAYVRLVMENYARYRQLYEGLDRPSLPR